MEQKTNLLNFQEVVDENKKLDDLFFESEYFNNFMESDEGTIPTTTKVRLKAVKGIDKKGKAEFILIKEFLVKAKDEVFNEALDCKCKNLEELLNIFESEKEELKVFKQASDKGIMFDNRRYWWKTKIENNKVYFIEKVIAW